MLNLNNEDEIINKFVNIFSNTYNEYPELFNIDNKEQLINFKNLSEILEIFDVETISRFENFYNKKLQIVINEFNNFCDTIKVNEEFSDLNWDLFPKNEVLENNPTYKFIKDKLDSIQYIKKISEISSRES